MGAIALNVLLLFVAMAWVLTGIGVLRWADKEGGRIDNGRLVRAVLVVCWPVVFMLTMAAVVAEGYRQQREQRASRDGTSREEWRRTIARLKELQDELEAAERDRADVERKP